MRDGGCRMPGACVPSNQGPSTRSQSCSVWWTGHLHQAPGDTLFACRSSTSFWCASREAQWTLSDRRIFAESKSRISRRGPLVAELLLPDRRVGLADYTRSGRVRFTSSMRTRTRVSYPPRPCCQWRTQLKRNTDVCAANGRIGISSSFETTFSNLKSGSRS